MEAVLLVAKFFGFAFTALLPVINPLGSALVFLGVVGPATPDVYRTLARRVAINTVLFFFVIELVGSALLNFFGISLPIVQVSGGFVLAAMGWSLLNQKDAEKPAPDRVPSRTRHQRQLRGKGVLPADLPGHGGTGLHCRDAHAERRCLKKQSHQSALCAPGRFLGGGRAERAGISELCLRHQDHASNFSHPPHMAS